MSRVAIVILVAGACRDEASTTPVRAASPLERAIGSELATRFGVPLTVTCQPDRKQCIASGKDIELPIRLADDAGGLDWQIEGLVVKAAAIEEYVKAELAELGSADTVHCGPRLRRVAAGDRIACELGRGGKAFATVSADGSTTYEIELDPLAGRARGETDTDERDRELLEMSRKLDEDVPSEE